MQNGDSFTRSAGNVFADLCLPSPEALKRQATYAALIQRVVEDPAGSPKRVADQLGITEDELSNILRGRFGQVGEGRLLGYVAALGHDVEIRVKPRNLGTGTIVISIENRPQK